MKNLLLTLALLVSVAAPLAAQQTEAPRTEFAVALSEDAISLKPGETKTVTLTLLKSRQYLKSKAALAFSSSVPAGLTIQYSPADGVFDSSIVTIAAAADAKEGQYTIILKATMNNRIKGSVLKITVGADSKSLSGE